MTHLLALVLPLALGAAFSPTLLVAGVLLLSAPTRPQSRAAAFTVGAAIPLVGVAAIGLVVFRHAGRGHGVRVSPVVDLVFGAVLMLLAARVALRKPSPDRHPVGALVQARPATCVLLGLGLMVANFSSLALFIPAVKEVALSSAGLGGQLGVLALVCVIVLLPVLVPMLLFALAPGRAHALLAPVTGWANRNSRAITIAVCVIFGVYLLVKGSLRV